MRKGKIIGIVAALVLLGGVGYWIYDNMTGNHIEIESLITPESGAASPAVASTASPAPAGSPASSPAPATAAPANGGEAAASPSADAFSGQWVIDDSSKVYFSVTTSRETVNYEIDQVSGTWTINSAKPAESAAEGTVQLSSMNSGSGQRDTHVKSADYLDVATHPEATFKATGFEGLPEGLVAQTVYPVKIKGELTVKGITKEVEFSGNTILDNSVLKLEANTVVTFDDYGMKNPHNVVMDTENNITVELRLTLAQA